MSSIKVNGSPAYGADVTFSVDTNDTDAWVEVTATQAGVVVYEDRRKPAATFTLGPTLSWSGGPADGHARLWHVKNGRLTRVIAETAFAIGA